MTIMQKLLAVAVSLAVLLLLTSHTQARRLNCRIQVFHPRCRGAYAKRSGGDGLYQQEDPVSGLSDGGTELMDYPPYYSNDEDDLSSSKMLNKWSEPLSEDTPHTQHDQPINLMKLLLRVKAALHNRAAPRREQAYGPNEENF